MTIDDLRLLVELNWSLNYLRCYMSQDIVNPFECPETLIWLHNVTRKGPQECVIDEITNTLWYGQRRS